MIEIREFDKYQDVAESTSLYSNSPKDIMSVALLLASEAGEVAGKLDKANRKGNKENTFMLDNLDHEAVKLELGDVLWAVAVLAKLLKIDLHDIASANAQKLADRVVRDVIVGSGDDR